MLDAIGFINGRKCLAHAYASGYLGVSPSLTLRVTWVSCPRLRLGLLGCLALANASGYLGVSPSLTLRVTWVSRPRSRFGLLGCLALAYASGYFFDRTSLKMFAAKAKTAIELVVAEPNRRRLNY
jgi:hypothetical protein